MLTRKQYDLLQFIHRRLQKDGVPPSFDEMKEALDLRSKSGIHRLITALEERGFIRRLAHRARAIEIVKLPETLEGGPGFAAHGGRPAAGPSGRRAAAGRGRVGRAAGDGPHRRRHADRGDPAGLAQRRRARRRCWRAAARHYALEVKGDSMIEAGHQQRRHGGHQGAGHRATTATSWWR